MMNDLEEILRWFEITERQRSMVESRVRELMFQDFESLYVFVSQYVDFLNDYFYKKQQLRLDQVSKSTQDKILAVEDEGLRLLWHEHELIRSESRVSMEDAYYFLMDKLPEQDLNLLVQLMNNAGVHNILSLIARDLDDDLSGIQSRIQQVRERFTIGGRLRIPNRMIKEIEFDPLEIKFVIRNYHGNPLQYFRDNFEIYEGLSRSELVQLDEGLYQRLNFHGQLEEAIPEHRGNPPAKPAEISDILEAYEVCGGVVNRAAELTGWSVQTVKRKWIEHKLKIKDGRALTQKDNERIMAAHALYDGNGKEASRNLPYPYQTILKKWKEAGLKPANKRNELSKQKVDEIIEAHEIYGGNAAEATRHLPYDKKTIHRYWRSNGLKPLGNSLSEDDLDTILAAHKTYGGNGLEASRNLPYHYLTILRKWKEAGLKPAGKRKKRKTERI